jgi:hypothetical protein
VSTNGTIKKKIDGDVWHHIQRLDLATSGGGYITLLRVLEIVV